MQYSKITIQTHFSNDFAVDLLTADLADLGCDSFENDGNLLLAYIQTELLSNDALAECLQSFPYEGATLVSVEQCEDKDWNEEWEKSFQPIEIAGRLTVCPPWKTDVTTDKIIINPKMAFGTGSHQTTSLLLAWLLNQDLRGQQVLDMGCGTAVLAIMASKQGAEQVTAVDIDDWCTENAKENIALNSCTNIDVLLGDSRVLEGKKFNLILANINRNILLMDMAVYFSCLLSNGRLVMSGFYETDIPVLDEKAASLGLTRTESYTKENWACAVYQKQN